MVLAAYLTTALSWGRGAWHLLKTIRGGVRGVVLLWRMWMLLLVTPLPD